LLLFAEQHGPRVHLSSLGKSTTSLLKHSIMGADDITLLSFAAAFEDIERAASKSSDGGRIPKMLCFAKCRRPGDLRCLQDSILISPIPFMASLLSIIYRMFFSYNR
jgi:hypothetical protein